MALVLCGCWQGDGNVKLTLFLWRFVFKMRQCAVQGLLWGQWEDVWGKGAASWYSCASRRKTLLLGQWEALCALRGTADPKGASWILCAVGWPR